MARRRGYGFPLATSVVWMVCVCPPAESVHIGKAMLWGMMAALLPGSPDFGYIVDLASSAASKRIGMFQRSSEDIRVAKQDFPALPAPPEATGYMGDEDAVTILDAITGDVIHVAPGPHVSSFVTRTAPIRRPDAAVGRRGGGRMEVIEVLPRVPVARDIPVASRRREGKAAEEEMFASGFATEEGMAGVVYEQQTITATTDTTGTFCLRLSTASEQSKPSCVRANVRDGDVATGVELEAALAKIGAEVKVTVSDGGGSNNRGHEWTITFLSSSDAANLAVNVSGLTSGKVTVVERVKGSPTK